MKKYFIKVFGCAMNVADTERIAGWYEARGYRRTEKPREANEVVIVTCSVRQTAEDRVYGLINNLAKYKIPALPAGRQNTKYKIILTGCMLRYPLKYLKEKLPNVDEFVKISNFKFQNSNLHEHSSKVCTLVPIMEGCNNFCSYCVVPYARGREVSRPFEEIVCEVEGLARRGYKEITLLGQNVNSYGKDFPPEEKRRFLNCFNDLNHCIKNLFATLLRTLHKIGGLEKISFLTSNPWDLDDNIIEAMALPKIDRYLHLPVQSGDDEILRKMNRHYTAEDYLKLVKKIRTKIPDIKIGTDIIVGFPGETEEQFQNTVQLCKKVGFVKAYVAMYSPRLQTAAYKLVDEISHKEKRRRWKILDDLINKNPAQNDKFLSYVR